MSDSSRVALIIGIDVYNNEDLEDLAACRKDVEELYKLLSSLGYTVFEEEAIIGSKLDKEYGWIKIRETIGNFFLDARPSQTLLFYFSGHGILKADEVYLGTPQIDPKKPSIKGLSLSELANNMNSSKSKQVVCIIDACYSGAAELPGSKGSKNDAMRASATYDKIWKRVPKAEGRYLLLSSQAYERSWAIESNSLYTKYLIEGLNGVKFETDDNEREIPYSGSVIRSTGHITPESIHNYIYYKVASQIDQTPKLRVDRSSEIILAYYPKLAETKQVTSQKEQLLQLLKDGNVTDFHKITKSILTKGKIKHGYQPDERAKLEEPFQYRLDFMHTEIYNVNLAHIDLHDADICLSHLNDSNLSYANLNGTNLANTYFEYTILKSAKLKNAYMSQTKLHNADLSRAKLLHSFLLKVELNNAKLSKAKFCNSVIVNCQSYPGPVCADADFEGATLDQESLVQHLNKNGAKNVPCAVTSMKELKSELKKKNIKDKLFGKILERSVFHKPEQSLEDN